MSNICIPSKDATYCIYRDGWFWHIGFRCICGCVNKEVMRMPSYETKCHDCGAIVEIYDSRARRNVFIRNECSCEIANEVDNLDRLEGNDG